MASDLTDDISVAQLHISDNRDPREVGIGDHPSSRSTSYLQPDTVNRRLQTVSSSTAVTAPASDDDFWSSNVMSRSDPASRRFMQDEASNLLKESRLSSHNECLQLRQQVSALFQENCSLKEKQAKQTMENRSLKKQATWLRDDNARLKERLLHFSQQLRGLVQSRDGGVTSLLVSQPGEQTKLLLDLLNAMQRSSGLDDGRSLSSGHHHLQHHHTAVTRVSSAGAERHTPSGPVSWDVTEHQSLEQISNKLLDHLKQEKMELEQQYSQVAEIQKSGSYQVSTDFLGPPSFEFSLTVDKDMLGALESCKNSSRLMKNEVKRQNEMLNSVFQQMEILQKAHTELLAQQADAKRISSTVNHSSGIVGISGSSADKMKNDAGACRNGSEQTTHHSSGMHPSLEALLKTYGNTLPDWEQQGREGSTGGTNVPTTLGQGVDDDRICPMCQAVFPRTIPLREFESHVMEHFSSEDFEIITQENDLS